MRGLDGRPVSDNMKGAAFMTLGMAGFSSNDAMIKLVAGEVALFQAIFLRGLIVSTLLGAVCWAQGAFGHRLGPRNRRILSLRCLGEIFATSCFLTALFHMPLANATAILQSLPLALTLAAALFLGEPVGWRRYVAIAVGFAGVLVIVRPGAAGFNVYGLIALAAVGFIVLRDLSTRLLSPDVPSVLAAFVAGAALTLVAGLVSLVEGWRPVAPGHLAALLASAGFLMVGYVFSIMGMRTGEISVVAPFRYTLMIWAILLGWSIYGDVPDAFMLTGAGIVIASGLYSFYRERRLGLVR